MSDELLPYYNEELSHIRNMAAEFAKSHPKIAARLRISSDTIEDPHVERLIEAFAYLNARIRHKLDDDLPELTDAMLGTLYPHYLAPLPSMAIVQLKAQSDLAGSYEVPAGAELETKPVDGEPCRFRTCYPLSLWPLNVAGASLAANALGAPSVPELANTASVVKLSLASTNTDVGFDGLRPGALRFYLRGQAQTVFPLYEALFSQLLQVVIQDPDNPDRTVALGAPAIQPVGFDIDQGMLPYPPQSFPGYRLLTEFFAFAEKFLFFDLAGVGENLAGFGSRLDVYLYLASRGDEFAGGIGKETFALGCTPMVNLFNKRAEPIQLDHLTHEYRVVPDVRRPKASEVYAIDKVSLAKAEGRVECRPLFGFRHGGKDDPDNVYWRSARRPAPGSNPGSEVYLSFVDLALDPTVSGKRVAHVDTTCLNRDLPTRLPFGGGEPKLRLAEGGAGVATIECLTAPTRTLRPPLRKGAMWRLISHLNLNHLSISGGSEGAAALREILRLYDFRDSAQTQAQIDGLGEVQTRFVTARMPSSRVAAMARGLEVSIELDPRQFVGSSAYLFGSVLDRFLTLYCGINSFTRLVVKLKGREGITWRWPARVGDKITL